MNPFYEKAVKAAVTAGKSILQIYGKNDFQVEHKADESPLTIADKKAHLIIFKLLKDTGIPILSEEGKEIVFEERKNWDQFWLVDPLDGTKEFIRRNGEFTVNIALIEKGKSIFGVVFAPVINELYVGIPGFGSFLCNNSIYFDQSFGELIKNSERLPIISDKKLPFRIVASRSHFNRATEEFIHALDTHGKEIKLVSKGSSLKLCMVASGEADVYPRLGPTMEWDVAAAHAIVSGAGKSVIRYDNNNDLEYNKQNLLNPFFVVR